MQWSGCEIVYVKRPTKSTAYKWSNIAAMYFFPVFNEINFFTLQYFKRLTKKTHTKSILQELYIFYLEDNREELNMVVVWRVH